ncbi:TPA: hypothetical protein RZC51_001614 [Burkholderia cenocepacia]|nr:hypothetical protein [Burkholderia cenocepacia]
MTAPSANLVKLPESIPFEAAARFGYIGTAYAGLKKAELEAGQTLIIDGATGTLGLGGTLCALGRVYARFSRLGATRACSTSA